LAEYSDIDAEKYIKIFTFLSKEEIDSNRKHIEAPHLTTTKTFGRRNYGDGSFNRRLGKCKSIEYFGNFTSDDLKELDEATFLEVLMVFSS
jgi:tyrosyl-tRNA synthetase